MVAKGIAWMNRRSVLVFSLTLLAVALTLALGGTPADADQGIPSSASGNETTLIFERVPGPDVPTLHEFARTATSDAVILARAVEYYQLNRDQLQSLWRENHPTRLAAIYAMYLVHISHPYGEATFPASLVEYLESPRAHCGTYTHAQAQIGRALGLPVRVIEFVGEHAWVEVQIDDQWEIFDATTNVWLSRGVTDLLAGGAREYRTFYTPMLDIDRPDARLHLAEGYDMLRLRRRMPMIGIDYNPPGELKIDGVTIRAVQ